jgi:hypothetical protein
MFDDIEIPVHKTKPRDWNLAQLLERVKVTFTPLNDDSSVMVLKATISGTSIIKLGKERNTINIHSGSITELEVLERLARNPKVLWEAHKRYIMALNKAAITRAAIHKAKT